MARTIEELLNAIAIELNRPVESMQPFIKILHEAWYDDEVALRELTET